MSDVKATDTLANERTFLAYVRTALAFIAFGFVIARFALFSLEVGSVLKLTNVGHGLSTAFGTAMAVLGSCVAVYGGYRYIVVARALSAGEPARSAPVAATVATAVVALLGIVVGFGLIAIR